MMQPEQIKTKPQGQKPKVLTSDQKIPKQRKQILSTATRRGKEAALSQKGNQKKQELPEQYAIKQVEDRVKQTERQTAYAGKQGIVYARKKAQEKKRTRRQCMDRPSIHTQAEGRLRKRAKEKMKSRPIWPPTAKGVATASTTASAQMQSKKTAWQTVKRMKATGNSVKHGAAALGKAAATAAKSTVAVVKSSGFLLAAGGGIAVVVVLFIGVAAAVLLLPSGNEMAGGQILSQEVLAYAGVIQGYAQECGIEQFCGVIQAIMMQESTGKGNDPMQCSECPLNTKYPNGITDPIYSIAIGIQYFAGCLSQAECSSPDDTERLSLAIQGYNYGNGYISWALTNFGGYSQANAQVFSDYQAAAHGWSSYGDPLYVPHVMRYLQYSSALEGTGQFIWPLPSCTNITSPFGSRGGEIHTGVDISDGNVNGKPIIAAAAGTVTKAVKSNPTTSYGLYVEIDHGNGYVTRYAHCSYVAVNVGDTVNAGQLVAYVGNTGNSTGPHLHFEVRLNGTALDPMQFFV